MEKITLLSEELEKIKKLNDQSNNIVLSLGQVELNLSILNQQKSELLLQFQDLQKEQNSLGQELDKKYGSGNIDLATGEFTPVE
jgi:hypothetical protein